MRAHLVNKIISGFSTILSLLLAITSTWILVSLLIKKYGNGEQKQTDCGDYPPDSWRQTDPTTTSSPCSNNLHPEFEDEHGHGQDAVVVESADPSFKMWTEFYEMKATFDIIAIICLSCSIVASLIQFGCSLAIIFSPPYKIATISRRALVILFVSFVIFLTCFSWPIAFKREYGDDDSPYHTISTLNSSVNDFFMTFKIQELFRDLTLYYFVIFANIIFLFFYMVATCCLLRCNANSEYDV